MGSVPPVDSMTISAQKTPVEMWTDATFEIGMLSSLLPKSFDFTRATRWALMVSLVGKRKLPCVQREAGKGAGEFGSAGGGGGAGSYVLGCGGRAPPGRPGGPVPPQTLEVF